MFLNFLYEFQNYLKREDRKIRFTAQFRKLACFHFSKFDNLFTV